MRNLALRLAPVVTVLLVAILLFLQIVVRRDLASRRVGISYDPTLPEIQFTAVAQDSPAERAGLQRGDRLLAVDARPILKSSDFDAAAAGFRGGEAVIFRIERGQELLEVSVTPGMEIPWAEIASTIGTSLAFLIVAFACLRTSSGYLNGRVAFLFSAAVAIELAAPSGELDATTALGLMMSMIFLLVSGLEFAAEMHFISIFPERPPWLARHPNLLKQLYLGALGFAGVGCVLQGAVAMEPPVAWAATAFDTWNFAAFQLGLPAWALIVVGALAARMVVYPERAGRVALSILLLGNLPWFVVVLSDAAATNLVEGFVALPQTAWNLALLAYPVAVFIVLLLEVRSQEKILLGLADEIAEAATSDELAALIAVDVGRAIHPQWTMTLAAFETTVSGRVLQDSRPGRHDEPIPLLGLREQLSRSGRPMTIEALAQQLPAAELHWLRSQDVEVAVPLPYQRRADLLGLILVGPKKSGEPYTRSNLALLRSIAGPVASALENLHLAGRLDEHVHREQHVLARLLGNETRPMKECPQCGRCFDPDTDRCDRDGALLHVPLPLERRLVDRYRLERKIGQGGMGAVYQAWDERLKRWVAFKVLLAAEFGQPEPLRRFEREARICAGLVHPHIVAVYDFGALPRGGAFLVMELLEGISLRAALERFGSIKPATAADWFDQILGGLERAHRERVVHRDLKPANIWLSGADSSRVDIKILDFGLARVAGSGSSRLRSLTAEGTILGTLPYMSPEQLSGSSLDFRSDLFSVGVILAECLTGGNPFERATTSAIATAILNAEFHLPRGDREWAELDGILASCLAKRPWERPASAEALRVRLVPALRRAPELATPAASFRSEDSTHVDPGFSTSPFKGGR